ncbi:hypothetical protein OOZ35_07390 [Mesoflavibacter profundi]|uniref:Peptidase M56 domain-containing protein n=1 Tax=Mesoflavibacter profundi TaxID=2708110 RepID=A0ABT4RZR4_9FLAO|nr:hypothetical protein [Mesoflavibacter profundi]MDA0177308.1 hypothetical protein [Mesoflavibacter profundi]
MYLVSKFLVPNGYVAITLFPVIILKNKYLKKDVVLLNHEKIHLRQQIELLIIGFYIWYVIEFLIRILKYKAWSEAYLNISFEREAYQNENNLDYLKSRSLFTFFRYL